MRRVVITGSCGFIGRQMAEMLREHGFDVWGIDQNPDGAHQVIQADLLNPGETAQAFETIGHFDVLIHLSALSTGTKPPEGYTLETVNVAITENILQAVADVGLFVYFSSTTVYGEEGRTGFVSPRDELRPASPYGIGKKRCEEMLRATSATSCATSATSCATSATSCATSATTGAGNFRSLAICRPTPVYSEQRLRNMRMRACFPFTHLKIKIYPNPSYSLCHLDTVLRTVLDIVVADKPGLSIRNLADATPYRQNDIADRFPGISWPVFTALFWPFYAVLKMIPGNMSYALRCKYRKLFGSCLYDTEVVEEPQTQQPPVPPP